MPKLKILTISFFLLLGFFGFANSASAATEFVSVVDTGSGTGYDYSSLYDWEAAMTNTALDLTSANTKVFSGTITGSISDNTTVYQCRSGVYQSVSGSMVRDTAAGQALVKTITGGASFQANDRWYTNNTCNSAGYFTISNTGDSAIAVAKCRATTGAADTAAVIVDGWTTGSSNYIKIWTDPSENYRHSGKWDEGKYRLEVSIAGITNGAIYIFENNVRVDGLQILVSGASPSYGDAISTPSSISSADIRISNNIIKSTATGTASGAHGMDISAGLYSSTVFRIWNNIIYDFSLATQDGILINSEGNAFYLYNNTIYNCTNGIVCSVGTTVAKNNIAYNNTTDYSGTFDSASTYNISKDNTAPGVATCPSTPGNCYYRSITNLAFVNAGTDFHLTSTDIRAKDHGANLYADGSLPITTDIDNQARPDSATLFDIGADEAANNVFYSVGQDGTTDRKVASNVTISSGVATFVSAQTGNIGVGDRVTYETGIEHICYIASKTSTTVWNLVTATGAACPDHASTDVVSIKREYTSLAGAIAGAYDSDHINNTDLTAANVVLNIPCYYDDGPDETAVVIDGYTTGAQNYIKIYTPNNTNTEANVSQRHSGKWNDSKYNLVMDANVVIQNLVGNLRIEGLQIQNTKNDNIWTGFGIYGGDEYGDVSNVYISNNIVRRGATGATYAGGIYQAWSGNNIKIYNNIVYGEWSSGIMVEDKDQNDSNVVYSNTVMGALGTGYNSGWENVLFKNNIAQDCANGFQDSGWRTGSDYNLSDLASDAPGANSRNETTVAFADETNDDFHLSPTDTSAKNAGANLYADGSLPITTDIDGQARPDSATLFDIGADEAANNVFYSVGQNASNHCGPAGDGNNCGNVSIASGIATFTAAQAGTNLGVGDRLTYDGHIAYLATKTDTTHWSVVDQYGVAAGNHSSTAVTSIAHEFTTLSSAISLSTNSSHINNTDLTAANVVLNLPCYYDDGADEIAVTVDGYTTGAQNYIKIYTPNNTSTEANTSQRHSGKWDEGKYRLEAEPDSGGVLDINELYTKAEGLQVQNLYSGASTNRYGINISAANYSQIYNNIVKGINGAAENGICGNGAQGTKAWNNIIYDCGGYGIRIEVNDTSGETNYVYNNTVYHCGLGMRGTDDYKVLTVAKNNIVQDCTTDWNNYWHANSNYNLSDSANAPGANSKNSTTVSFADEANDDFHLSLADTSAKNAGANLYADGSLPITTDIDGQARPDSATLFDIGADEAANNVFYSVGQDGTTDRKVASNVTISSGVATFVSAQTGNIGVGDRVTYETGIEHICYISAKQSTSVWNLVTALGAACPDHTSTDVVSIKREFTSLSSAISLSSNSGHIDNTDLVAANVVLNIPCYYDSAADTTAVTVDGYTTGANNYIKIYTPNNTSTEANTSQRHSGKWNTGKYRLETTSGWREGTLTIREENVSINGLQINNTGANDSVSGGIVISENSAAIDIKLSDNIILGITSEDDNFYSGIIIFNNNGSGSINIWNNIIYDFKTSSPALGGAIFDFNDGIGATGNPIIYAYNNTAINSDYGYRREYETFIAKNNLAYNNTDNYSGTFTSSTNNLSGNNQGDAPGSNPRNLGVGETITFADEANDDFHLSLADTGARDYGTSLANDSNLRFSDDIDGDQRPGTWDIGADEQPGVVYHATEPRVEGLTSGLVLYQSFDGAHMDWSRSAGEARDQSGQNNNGDVNNMGQSSVTGGKLGQALNFNGTNDRINQGTSSSLQPANVTVSYWLKRTESWSGVCGNAIVWAKGDGWAGNGWYIETNDRDLGSGLVMVVDGGNYFYVPTGPNTLFPLNEWVHITATFNSSTNAYAMYINGVAQTVTNGNSPDSITSTSDIKYLGYKTVDNVYLKGGLDELRVYDRVLSTDEIGELYRMGQVKINKSWTDSSKTGLVGMWSFDGPDIDWSSNTAYDRSGNNNNGAISGATAAIGKRGQGLSFDGSSSYINVAQNSGLPAYNLGTYSISMWVKGFVNQGSPEVIFAEGNDSNANPTLNFSADINSNKFMAFIRNDTGTVLLDHVESTGAVLDGSWRHIVWTDNNGVAALYIDGTLDSANFNYTHAALSLNTTAIAAFLRGGPDYHFNGLIDEVRVYNRALSETEIGDLYRMGQVQIKR